MKTRKQVSNRRSYSHSRKRLKKLSRRRLKKLSRRKSKSRSKNKQKAGNIIFGLGSQGYTNPPPTTRKALRHKMKVNKGRAAFNEKKKTHIKNVEQAIKNAEEFKKLPKEMLNPPRRRKLWIPALALATASL